MRLNFYEAALPVAQHLNLHYFQKSTNSFLASISFAKQGRVG
jgi:hypothetical protein